MERVETLREQASVLRSLAKSFDSLSFEGDLMALAKRCAELADEIERDLIERKSRAIAGEPTG